MVDPVTTSTYRFCREMKIEPALAVTEFLFTAAPSVDQLSPNCKNKSCRSASSIIVNGWMIMRRFLHVKFWTVCIAVVAAICGVATAAKALNNYIIDDFKGFGERPSRTLDEALDRGIVAAILDVDPVELDIPGGHIRFLQAWVEARSLPTHDYVWFPVERRRGGYLLRFAAEVNLANSDSSVMFVANNKGVGIPLRNGTHSFYSFDIPTSEASGVRMSVIRSWQEGRRDSIRFLPR